MKIVRMFQTSDGALHVSHAAALLHADKRVGDALTAHAHRLCQIDRYQQALIYLEKNLADLAAIQKLVEDRDTLAREEDA